MAVPCYRDGLDGDQRAGGLPVGAHRQELEAERTHVWSAHRTVQKDDKVGRGAVWNLRVQDLSVSELSPTLMFSLNAIHSSFQLLSPPLYFIRTPHSIFIFRLHSSLQLFPHNPLSLSPSSLPFSLFISLFFFFSPSTSRQRHGVTKFLEWRRSFDIAPPAISSFSHAYPGKEKDEVEETR